MEEIHYLRVGVAELKRQLQENEAHAVELQANVEQAKVQALRDEQVILGQKQTIAAQKEARQKEAAAEAANIARTNTARWTAQIAHVRRSGPGPLLPHTAHSRPQAQGRCSHTQHTAAHRRAGGRPCFDRVAVLVSLTSCRPNPSVPPRRTSARR